jgi:putative spermidine/putrescine transport system substrate-binding protein
MIKAIKATFLGLLSLALVTTAYADLTFVSWGGAYTASQQKGYINDWNGKVTVENYNGGLGEIKAQVEAGNVTWDVVDILPDQGITGCDEGLFEKIDNSAWKDDLVVPAVSDCVAPQIFWAYTAFYKKSAFPGKKTKKH